MRSLCVVAGLLGLSASAHADNAELYSEKIKPLLEERCYACHGALKQKGKLRVDTAVQIREAGVLDNGELIARLTSGDLDERMPPEGEALHAQEIEMIQAWITAGAPGPENEKPEDDPGQHWSFQTIKRPEIPPGDFGNPIDAFLAEKHNEQGLVPRDRADRTVLIRRLYLDLIGLPPTTEELADRRSYSAIIDELLANPHYGERWGRHWMDVWRYSDGYGLGAQLRYSQKHLWHWRDWIVNSLNDDKGYDRMILEMLAGDELAPEDPDVIAATGFLARNYYLFNRTTWLDNTIEHTGKAFFGLTMNCAKCHDHKYDPISHEDYYRFRAFFEPHQIRLDPIPGEIDFEKNGLPRAYDDDLEAMTYLHLRGNDLDPDKSKIIAPGVPEILADFALDPQPVDLPVSSWAPGLRNYVQEDHLAAADARLKEARGELAKAISGNALPLDTEPTPGKGFALTDHFDAERPEIWNIEGSGWRYQGGALVQLESTRDKQFARSMRPHPANFDLTVNFRTTGGDTYKSVGIRFDVTGGGRDAHTVYASAHAPGPKVQIAHTRAGQTSYPGTGRIARPVVVNEDYEMRVQVRDRLMNVSLNGEFLLAYQLPARNPNGLLELFAFDATAEFDSISVSPLAPETSLKESKNPAPKIDSKELTAVAEAKVAEAEIWLRTLKAKIAADRAGIAGKGSVNLGEVVRLKKEHAVAAAKVALLTAEAGKQAAAKKALAAAAKALKNPGNPTDYSPLRGSRKALETPEHKETDYAATYPKTSTGRRTALAKWITDRKNPLTARVAVNQIWLRHFGEPIVGSVFDFGRQTAEPELAELLDYLAMEFIESGWSMKHLHRLILTSEAWQRTSSNLNADPATLSKDSANAFLWRMNSRRMESQVIRDSLVHLAGELDLAMGGPSIEPTPDARRRSLYFQHSRDKQSQLLSTFDDAEILACYRRSESIIPQQALALSNSKLALEMAAKIPAAFGENLSTTEFAREAFQLILCREPNPSELAECVNFLNEEKDRGRLVHALLNHNDFIMIR
ncbi:MAG: PSD1 and planctomycete cytochrome C domain-containing protein [Verrucomicrobiales bacterium]|nr:PSD1 and planctomycete cytochrome C domain-containing protein [Verrucomicrobiales bacterium]